MIIGVSGHKQSGKDTCTNFLIEYLHKINKHAENKKFADKLKQICSIITGLPISYFYDNTKYDTYIQKWNLNLREIQQRIGTEAIRNTIHEDVWVDALFSEYTDDKFWIISDVRFINEINEIKKRNGILIRIINPHLKNTDLHSSETSLDNYKNWDYTIINDSSLDDFYKNIQKIIHNLDL